MYTHYVPGIALLAAANVMLARRRRWLDAVAIDSLTALSLLPWMAWLIPQLKAWGAHHVGYALTGGAASEFVLKLAFWAMSFTVGEAIPDPALLLGALLVPLVLILAFLGLRRNSELAWLAVPAAAVGFLGVTRWVAYPFIPARMIFCFPLFLTLLISGAATHRRIGRIAMWGMIAASLSGIWCYFYLEGFRNKQYPLPMAEIGERIRAASTGAHAAVLVDSSNSDIIGLRYARAICRSLSRPKIRAPRRRWHAGSPTRPSARSGFSATPTTPHQKGSTRDSLRSSARGCASPLIPARPLRRSNFD
jgi:hypothetical protein